MTFSVDPNLLASLDNWESRPVCFLCKGNGPFHRHHKRFRSHGGGEGNNLVLLCEVCHGAAHGLKLVKHGFSCKTCPVLARSGCYFGEVVLNLERKTEPPWTIEQFLDNE